MNQIVKKPAIEWAQKYKVRLQLPEEANIEYFNKLITEENFLTLLEHVDFQFKNFQDIIRIFNGEGKCDKCPKRNV